MLIVLEGLDGAGKSTQIKKLREYLNAEKGNHHYIHFPRYDAPVTGELISKFLRGDFGNIEDVHPMLVAHIYADDRYAASYEFKPWLEKNETVLFDRYVYSNIAFQCAKLKDEKASEELKKWIIDMEYGTFSLPKPDLNIFLDVPIDFVDSNLHSSREGDNERDYLHGKQDIHEADITFQKRVRSIYLDLCNSDPSFIRIDCSDKNGKILSPNLIFEKIKLCVN